MALAVAVLDNLLCFLQKLEDGWHSDPPMKDIVHRLKLKMDILISEYQQSGTGSIRLSEDGDARSPLTDLEKLVFIKPEMEEMHSAAFNSSKSNTFENEKDVVGFINSILEDTKDISEDDFHYFVNVKILDLRKELGFLRNFLSFISQFGIEHSFSQDHYTSAPADLYTFAQVVAVNAAYLLHFLRMDKKMYLEMAYRMEGELSDLVGKLQQPDLGEIYLHTLEGISQELHDFAVTDYECILCFFYSVVDHLKELSGKVNLESIAKDQIKFLHQELRSLDFYFMNLPLHDADEKLDHFMFKIQELTIQVGCFIYSCICRKKNQFTFLESDGGLLDRIEEVKSECNHLFIPRSWQLNFPKTNEVGYIDFIIKNLEERLHCKSAPIDRLKSQINTVYEELVTLRDDFDGFLKLQNDDEKLRAIFIRYKDAAYQVEYFVDSCPCGIVPFGYQKIGLCNLAEDLRHIKKELKQVLNDTVDHNIGQRSTLVSLKANAQNSDAVLDLENEVHKRKDNDASQLVGFEDETEKIKDHLLGGSKQLTIIAIFGMPGLGKTTLANSLFRDPSLIMQFHAHAWCSVSQGYNKDKLLLEVLHQIQRESVEDHGKNENDLMLYQSLKGRRYLVIMDDIWDIDAWNDLSPSFPNDGNGSRIIFTTRNQSVARQANTIPHSLRQLSYKESLKLLLVRVFEEEALCPLEILPIARKIAKQCKCLPLTVVLTAGLLKNLEKTNDSWEQLAYALTSHETLGEQYLGILELSYMHLPDYLKPCFLYFGAFREDAEIPTWMLVHLWIAEGFVQPKADLNAQENEAEDYLSNLIDRCLVMIVKRSYNGRVKTCKIHDVLHDFCTKRAKEESFLLKINWLDSLSTLADSEVHEQYRLCIHSNTRKVPPVKMGHFESRVRSLFLLIADNDADSPLTAKRRLLSPPFSSRFIYYNELHGLEVFFKFRLLRVLLLSCLTLDIEEEDFDTITRLVHLRYLVLSMSKCSSSILSGIANLKNLDTFFLFSGGNDYIELPKTIWNMVNLRHIQVIPCASFSTHNFFENCSKLDCLTTLSTLALPIFPGLVEVEKTMRKLPNLKKLKCKFREGRDITWFIVLDFLHQLEDLKIRGRKWTSLHVLYPSSLKKLSLGDISLSRDQISVIGELSNLEVLKLSDSLFQGLEWHMKEGEFQKLKVLKLQSIQCDRWYASSEHLPRLEKLILRFCRYLEEIPLDFGASPFLTMIEVNCFNNTLLDSARKIKEEQHGMGNDQFNLYISGTRYPTFLSREM